MFSEVLCSVNSLFSEVLKSSNSSSFLAAFFALIHFKYNLYKIYIIYFVQNFYGDPKFFKYFTFFI